MSATAQKPAPTTPESRTKEIKDLLVQRRALADQLVKFQGRDLAPEEAPQYEELRNKITELDTRVTALEAEITGDGAPSIPPATQQNSSGKLDDLMLRLINLLESRGGSGGAPSAGRQSAPTAPNHVRDYGDRQAKRDIHNCLQGWGLRSKGMLNRDHREAAERCGFDLANDHIQLRLFDTQARSSKEIDKRYEESLKENRAQATSPGSAGGFTIQTDLQKELEKALLYWAPLRQYCRVIRTDQGNPLDIPFMNDTNNRGEIVAENTAFNSLDLVFSKQTYNAWLYNSKIIPVSIQTLQDSAVNLPEVIGGAAGERLGRINTDHQTTGTGTGQPAGLLTAGVGSSLGWTATSPTGIGYADIIKLFHSVDRAYRENGYFMMSDGVLMLVRLIVDGYGRPIFQQSYTEGEPDRILGRPIIINNSMAAVPAAGVKSILFGDLQKNYIIRDCMDMTLVRLNERYAEYGQVAFFALMRNDSRILYNQAIKHLIH